MMNVTESEHSLTAATEDLFVTSKRNYATYGMWCVHMQGVVRQFCFVKQHDEDKNISFQSVLCCDAGIRKSLYKWHGHGSVDRWVCDEEIYSVGSVHDEILRHSTKTQPEHVDMLIGALETLMDVWGCFAAWWPRAKNFHLNASGSCCCLRVAFSFCIQCVRGSLVCQLDCVWALLTDSLLLSRFFFFSWCHCGAGHVTLVVLFNLLDCFDHISLKRRKIHFQSGERQTLSMIDSHKESKHSRRQDIEELKGRSGNSEETVVYCHTYRQILTRWSRYTSKRNGPNQKSYQCREGRPKWVNTAVGRICAQLHQKRISLVFLLQFVVHISKYFRQRRQHQESERGRVHLQSGDSWILSMNDLHEESTQSGWKDLMVL